VGTLRFWWQSKALATSCLRNQKNQRCVHGKPRYGRLSHTPVYAQRRQSAAWTIQRERTVETLRFWWQSIALATSYLRNQRNQRCVHEASRYRDFGEACHRLHGF